MWDKVWAWTLKEKRCRHWRKLGSNQFGAPPIFKARAAAEWSSFEYEWFLAREWKRRRESSYHFFGLVCYVTIILFEPKLIIMCRSSSSVFIEQTKTIIACHQKNKLLFSCRKRANDHKFCTSNKVIRGETYFFKTLFNFFLSSF